MLVAAFRATLEEVIEADVILHVRDVSHDDAEAQLHDVEEILRQLGIDPQRQCARQARADRGVEQDRPARRRRVRARLQNLAERKPADERPVLVSAVTGEGIDTLGAAIEARLAAGRVLIELVLDVADGAGMSWLYRHTEVISKATDETSGRIAMTVRADPGKADAVRDEVRRRSIPRQRRTSDYSLRLGLVPQRIHFGERGVLRRLAALRPCALDRGETAFEFLVGLSQHGLRIGIADGGRD